MSFLFNIRSLPLTYACQRCKKCIFLAKVRIFLVTLQKYKDKYGNT